MYGLVGDTREGGECVLDELDGVGAELRVVDEQEDARDDQHERGDQREECRVREPPDDEPATGAAIDHLHAESLP